MIGLSDIVNDYWPRKARMPNGKIRMDQVNPKYVLRNHLAERAIQQAVREKDYSEIDRLLELLSHPFTEQPGMEAYALPAPDDSPPIIVSCSS